MKDQLTGRDLMNLVKSVFSPAEGDSQLAIFVDVPNEKSQDQPNWRQRRGIAQSWYKELDKVKNQLGLKAIHLILYPNVGSNNADLPATCYTYQGSIDDLNSAQLTRMGTVNSMADTLQNHQLIIALTQYSATAPLKLEAKKYGFRAATMPGFSTEMIPALKLDYAAIHYRVMQIKDILDAADTIEISFVLDSGETYNMTFDIRFRTAHASSGRFPENGVAGNLPSGESYIVPYEGEKEETTKTSGTLPVQFEDEIVLYRVVKNRAVEVLSSGHFSDTEREKLAKEPAYGNMAEVGFGVLADFGVTPIGEILLDEKLGLHIAFGRSDHFGGIVGIKNFSKPENVIHIDRIYIPEIQNKIHVSAVDVMTKRDRMRLMEDGKYTIF